MSKEEEYEPLPEGTRPLLLNMKQMDKWELKTGPRLIDVVPYKWIPLEDIKADLQFAGALSPWSSVKSEINVSCGPCTRCLLLAGWPDVPLRVAAGMSHPWCDAEV